MKIFKYYINYSYFFDIILVFILFGILYNIDLPYWEIPEYWLGIISASFMLIFTDSEKIQRLKKSSQFKQIAIQFLLYVFLYFSSSYVLNTNLSHNVLFNAFISLGVIAFIRILVYTIFLWNLYINSKIR